MTEKCPKCGAKPDVDLDRDNPQAAWTCGSFPFIGRMEGCEESIWQSDKCRIAELEEACRTALAIMESGPEYHYEDGEFLRVVIGKESA